MYKNNQLKISVHTSNQTLFMQDKFNSTNTGKLNPACSLVPAQKDLILSLKWWLSEGSPSGGVHISAPIGSSESIQSHPTLE